MPGIVVVGAQWGDEGKGKATDLLGGRDTAEGFVPGHPLLAETARRHPGLRVPRTGAVLEALVPAVLEQKVTGKEARAAFRTLVLRHGEPAPGPYSTSTPLRLLPGRSGSAWA